MRIGALAVALTAVISGATTAGCGGEPGAAPTTSAVANSGEPDGGYDVGRLTSATGIFPDGVKVTQMPKETLSREQADQRAGLYGSIPMTYDPPDCRALADPFQMSEGSEVAGIRSAQPPSIVVMASRAKIGDPDWVVGPECQKVNVTSPQGVSKAGYERIPGPAIDGVTTLGTRAQLQSGGGSETRTLYTFVAVLSPQTSVMIQGSENPDQLKAMLVKSVAAIRG
ncbi:hypothetical protein BST26_18390 [Mycolicibacterium insubricum]|uniref:DUF5642 domain-containing protein n=1 Tax=Mycolicibacterium insubricum TaxID=444597 RepID=A0A1X0CZX1_9MYCO|nr:DUF5642 family protein [Mycolicibacterium insubricum]ORA65706.1 hypothetical protein BST26_18390 [Mycolicibacterium insubricum]